MSFDSAQLKRSPLLPEGLELKFQYQAGCQLFEYTIHLAQLLALWCLGGLKKVQQNLMLPLSFIAEVFMSTTALLGLFKITLPSLRH